jgi:hypothetical protein
VSSTLNHECDGCRRTVAVAPGARGRTMFPMGWLRLHVHGRSGADAILNKVETVDVCCPDCAPEALEKAFARVNREVAI